MPYRNKELKKEYQQRTATPYMSNWREENREHHRNYMREWARKRRADVKKKANDAEKAKTSTAFEANRVMNREKWRGAVIGMTDQYIIGLLTRKGSIEKDAITPELIKYHRKQLLTKRLLKNDNLSNKQHRHEKGIK